MGVVAAHQTAAALCATAEEKGRSGVADGSESESLRRHDTAVCRAGPLPAQPRSWWWQREQLSFGVAWEPTTLADTAGGRTVFLLSWPGQSLGSITRRATGPDGVTPVPRDEDNN